MISVLDTRIPDNNLGNYIIMEAIDKFLDDQFKDEFVVRIPYMDNFGKQSIKYMKDSRMIFIGGTNILSSHMFMYKQIGLNIRNSYSIGNKFVLFGVGWWRYQKNIDLYTRYILKNSLSNGYIHSCRDEYTVKKLKGIGIDNVINTGCPSLWSINASICDSIPTKKSENVLITFTNYDKNYVRDKKIMDIIKNNYDSIYCWIQGPDDYNYVKDLNSKVKFISPRLSELDHFLYNNDVDYVGTRLHAGIRCIQKAKRTIILGIDNRALEMKKTFSLPVLHISSINSLEQAINSIWKTSVKNNYENINLFCSQFISQK